MSINVSRLRTIAKQVLKATQLVAFIMLCLPNIATSAAPNKNILYINSYHQGYQWSDGIAHGIQSRLLVEDVTFETFYMDSKRQRSPDYLKKVGIEIKNLIDKAKPDIVITSDDNAVKHVLAPYYKNATLPFVFCGVNWDASDYGLPFQNATGMLETSLIASIVDLLSQYAAGPKIGLLSIDAESERRSIQYYNQELGKNIDQPYFVNSVQEWQSKFLALQSEVDMMILENPEGLEGWGKSNSIEFVQRETKIPVGAAHAWLAPLSLISIAKVPEEQGWWAAEHAMQVLNGKNPAEIPIAQNRQGKLYANITIADQLKVTFSPEILQTATIIKE